jgi:hypothetical protein
MRQSLVFTRALSTDLPALSGLLPRAEARRPTGLGLRDRYVVVRAAARLSLRAAVPAAKSDRIAGSSLPRHDPFRPGPRRFVPAGLLPDRHRRLWIPAGRAHRRRDGPWLREHGSAHVGAADRMWTVQPSDPRLLRVRRWLADPTVLFGGGLQLHVRTGRRVPRGLQGSRRARELGLRGPKPALPVIGGRCHGSQRPLRPEK